MASKTGYSPDLERTRSSLTGEQVWRPTAGRPGTLRHGSLIRRSGGRCQCHRDPPNGAFVVYGLGIPQWRMVDPAAAWARVPVPPEE